MSDTKSTENAIWGFIIWLALVLFIVNVDLFPDYDYNVLGGIAIAILFVMIYALIHIDD